MRAYVLISMILYLIAAGTEAQKGKVNWLTVTLSLALGIWGAILLGYY